MKITQTIHNLREPIEIRLTVHSRVRKWAAENAYMLILMAVLFGATWLWIFLSGVRRVVG